MKASMQKAIRKWQNLDREIRRNRKWAVVQCFLNKHPKNKKKSSSAPYWLKKDPLMNNPSLLILKKNY